MSGTPEEKRRADLKTVLLVDNSTWNLYNFRRPLIRCLRATGYRVLALAPPDGYAGLLNGLRLIPLRHLRARGRHIPSDLQLLAELYRHYSRLRPDLILHFTIKPNIFGSLAARQLGIRSVAVVTGLGYPFLRGGWLLGLVRVLYGQAMRASSQVVCYNAEDEVFLRDAGLVRPGQVAVIPGSGVDVHHFSPRLPGMGTPFRFLFVGRLLYDKGIREYVQAARRLALRYPAVEWWILGEYNPDYPAAVKAEELVAWTCESSIRYLGQVRDVRPYLQNSCVVVLPSYREGLARSLQEALALARPVITTDVAGCREVVDAGQNGWLVPARDVSALASAMEAALRADRQTLRRMGQHSRTLACDHFDDRSIAQRFVRLVQQNLEPDTTAKCPVHAHSDRTHSQWPRL